MVVNYNVMMLNMVLLFMCHDKQEVNAGTKLAEWDPIIKLF